MGRQTRDWREEDTWVPSTLDRDSAWHDLRVPGLTLLAHPDVGRVGERVTLTALSTGREALLSRCEPDFLPPGNVPDGARRDGGRPLQDPHLSRQPIRFTPGTEAGAVVLDRRATQTTVEADGRSVDGARVFSPAELSRGVVLLLGRRLVLLLHYLLPVSSRALPHFGLVGDSSTMVRVRQDVLQAAALELPVLLRGETGTGKDLVARAIHDAGERRRRSFVAVNMGAVPPSLAASELFGANRGAFTGADHKRSGFFQHAHHGTLFLDEIGETPLEVQGLLLRALESGEIQPVGSVHHQLVDVRTITATDSDLESAVADGRFRAPLYHRLAGYQIRLPPLRKRRDDVGRLLFHFLAEELRDDGGLSRGSAGAEPPWSNDDKLWPPAEVVARLARHHWPGNVRELRNVARRLAMERRSGSGEPLRPWFEEILSQPAAAPPRTASPAGEGPAVRDRREAQRVRPCRRRFRRPSEISEKEMLAALRAHRWRLQPTAAALRISRATLYRLIEHCPQIRKAAEIDRAELEDALRRFGGDPRAAAAALEVSPQGLKMRMNELGVAR